MSGDSVDPENNIRRNNDSALIAASQNIDRSFDDLEGFEAVIAWLFIQLARLFNPQNNDSLANAFSEILGMARPEYDSWHRQQSDTGWSDWQRTTDFAEFDFDSANDLIANPPEELLDLIAQHESNGDYNIAWGGARANFTEMSINDVLRWQDQQVANGSQSSAVGRYQIIRGTLRQIKEDMDLTGEEQFSPEMQDRMAMHLLVNTRNFDDFVEGRMSLDQMMENLSMEWASLPKDFSGLSYYDGDGLNRASAHPAVVRNALLQAREDYIRSHEQSAEPELIAGSGSISSAPYEAEGVLRPQEPFNLAASGEAEVGSDPEHEANGRTPVIAQTAVTMSA